MTVVYKDLQSCCSTMWIWCEDTFQNFSSLDQNGSSGGFRSFPPVFRFWSFAFLHPPWIVICRSVLGPDRCHRGAPHGGVDRDTRCSSFVSPFDLRWKDMKIRRILVVFQFLEAQKVASRQVIDQETKDYGQGNPEKDPKTDIAGCCCCCCPKCFDVLIGPNLGRSVFWEWGTAWSALWMGTEPQCTQVLSHIKCICKNVNMQRIECKM